MIAACQGALLQVPVRRRQGEVESRGTEQKARLKLTEPDRATAEVQVGRGVGRLRARKRNLLGTDCTPAQLAELVQ
jgi:hypothetical protein